MAPPPLRTDLRPGGRPPRLLGVWAHPDDEAYLTAGLMGRIVDAGGAVVCLHATDGEHGTGDPARWPPARLAAVRRLELRASLAAVGVTDLRRLGLPDGGLTGADAGAAVAAIGEVVGAVAPDLVVTFGPDGVTGHPDHRAVGRWATEAWDVAGRPGELLYATTTAAFVERNRDLYAAHELVLAPGLPVRTPAGRVALDVALSEAELDRKQVALAAHASQTRPLADLIGAERFRRWFDHETFRRPTPAEVGALVAADATRNAPGPASAGSGTRSLAGTATGAVPARKEQAT